MPQRRQYFESAACWSEGRACERVVETEGDAARAVACEIADLRVVGVDDERGVAGERVDRGAPALGDLLQLAVAVELVAEQVAEAHRPRPDPPRDVGKGALVDLEQAELARRAR